MTYIHFKSYEEMRNVVLGEYGTITDLNNINKDMHLIATTEPDIKSMFKYIREHYKDNQRDFAFYCLAEELIKRNKLVI